KWHDNPNAYVQDCKSVASTVRLPFFPQELRTGYNALMRTKREKRTADLATLYARFVDRHSAEWRTQCAIVCRERSRKLGLLNQQGVCSVADLLSRLPSLSPGLKKFGIDLIWLLEIRQAIPVVLEVMLDPKSDRG